MDVIISDNSIGGIPTLGEGWEAYQVMSEDARIKSLAAGREYAYHIHQVTNTDPAHPCSDSRCLLVSLDVVSSRDENGKPVYDDHYAYTNVNMNSKRVETLHLAPEALGFPVPGMAFAGIDIRDFEGNRVIGLDEIRDAAKTYFSDPAISDSLKDKTHLLVLSAGLDQGITASTWLYLDLGGSFRDYVRTVIDETGSSLIGNPCISGISVQEAEEAALVALEHPAVIEMSSKVPAFSVQLEPIEGSDSRVDVLMKGSNNKGVKVQVDLSSKAVQAVSNWGRS